MFPMSEAMFACSGSSSVQWNWAAARERPKSLTTDNCGVQTNHILCLARPSACIINRPITNAVAWPHSLIYAVTWPKRNQDSRCRFEIRRPLSQLRGQWCRTDVSAPATVNFRFSIPIDFQHRRSLPQPTRHRVYYFLASGSTSPIQEISGNVTRTEENSRVAEDGSSRPSIPGSCSRPARAHGHFRTDGDLRNIDRRTGRRCTRTRADTNGTALHDA